MNKQEIRYVEAQMEEVAPLPVMEGGNGQFKIQFTSEQGKTNWMNITDDQFRKIEAIMLRCEYTIHGVGK